MRTKCLSLAILQITLLWVAVGSAWAAPSQELAIRWEGRLESQAAKLVVRNLSAQRTKVFLGPKARFLSAEGFTEIPANELGTGLLRLRSTADLLVLQTDADFDPRSLEVEKSDAGPLQEVGGKLLPGVLRPDWAKELIAGVPHVRHGATGAVRVSSDDSAARLEVAIEFLAPHSTVRIRQLDGLGNEVTSVVASASRPLRWRATLGPLDGESRLELTTLRGEAQGTAVAALDGAPQGRGRSPIAPLLKSGGGLGLFDPDINWDGNPTLYYRVSGAPPNVCGDSYVSRNYGSYVVTPGWICTDASGNATKGPWSWGSQSGDETAYAYIVWSNGLSTNTDIHIWDVLGPSASIGSPMASPAPTSFYGTGSDPSLGAGFSASWGSSCSNYFYDRTTDDYWDPYSNRYSNAYFPYHVPCTISGMPSHNVTWSQSQIPPGFAHISGHCYEWAVFLFESSHSSHYGFAKINFCVP